MAAALDPADLKTETLTNSKGWAVVRVTHVPTSLVAERSRTPDQSSPVQAQRECVDELAGRVGAAARPLRVVSETVGRAEFDALVTRVAELERRLDSAGS